MRRADTEEVSVTQLREGGSELAGAALDRAPSPHVGTSQELLEETENRFRTMADTAPVLLWMSRSDGLCDFFNQGWLSFRGRTMDQELGNGWSEGVHPEDLERCMRTYLDAFVARQPFAMEYRLRRHDGEYRWVFDQGAPRFTSSGAFLGYIGSCVDVTAQREARDTLERLNQLLAQQVHERTALASTRATLLREVHHRVKNELQLISSLLSIQGRQFGDSEAARAFEKCRARLSAIARIHEQMYQSDDLRQMSFTEHLRSLTLHVDEAGAPPPGVRLELEPGKEVMLRVDQAVPCAMLVHELVVNALKHAFVGGRRGRVRVACRREPEGVLVVVEDDGVGMPELPRGSNGSGLGWNLIEAFARQLGAGLNVVRAGGTRVEVRFADAAAHGVGAQPGAAGAPGAVWRQASAERRVGP